MSDNAEQPARYLRFPLIYRLEHWTFAISFILLGFTGLVQKYAASPISQGLIAAMGGIESTRLIHRASATVMMVAVVYHIGIVGYRLFVERRRLSMLPTLADLQAAIGAFRYNLGLRKSPPQEGRYTYGEKVEYWAVVWGTVVMAVTGFMMWNPIATARFLPGEAIPAAKAAHGGEALLAILAIIIWHLYHVLVKTFNRSMFNGYISEEEMLHEHPLELADIKAGIANRPVDPLEIKRRQQTYVPVYSIVALILLAGIYWFIAFEQTAIATVPPAETVEVFAPLTPTPLPTLAPTPTSPPAPPAGAAVTWEASISALLEQKCSACHGAAALGGLNISTYQGALDGGKSGPGLVPGDPTAGAILTIQSAGGHPGQFTPAELETIRKWVEAGAPEK
jgi:formate dehydrogenase gamma subunit